MKYRLKFLPMFFLVFGAATALVTAQAADSDIARLQALVEIVDKINQTPVQFKFGTTEFVPGARVNLQKQAAFLKQLPAGTIVEIGVYTEPHYDPFVFDDAADDLYLTQKRAEAVRNELIKLGTRANSLIAKGYGRTNPISLKPTEESRAKNQRVEYRIEKMADGGEASGSKTLSSRANNEFLDKVLDTKQPAPVKQSPTAQTNVDLENIVIAGRGWGKVKLGAARTEIETAIGRNDKITESEYFPTVTFAAYVTKGFIITYDRKTQRVTEIEFIGDPVLYASEFEKYLAFQGKPDKNLAWGATSDQIIKAYGAPVHRYDATLSSGVKVVHLSYAGIRFIVKSEKLFKIEVMPKN